MDLNDYALEVIVRARLAELRADADRRRRLDGVRPTPSTSRSALRRAVVQIGTRLLRNLARVVAPARAMPQGVTAVQDPGASSSSIPMRLSIATLGLAVVLMSAIEFHSRAVPSTGDASTTPSILEKTEGEHRTRRPRGRPMPPPSFIIKVDRKNGGSPRMWLGTEDLPPGGVIQRHRHLGQDEVLLLQTGTAHVWLGTEERDAHAGAIVFIPSGTWIGLKNVGTDNISLLFVFSDTGFDDYLRCTSVPAGERPSIVTTQELDECRQRGRFEFEDARRSPTR
jgi:uncharacterized RmlC-like cupin family protein